jgi:ornithine cyclodeaminase/alanine dehydrogenase-like protein (mu-crystallin family)
MMTSSRPGLAFFSGDELEQLLPWRSAVSALRDSLRDGSAPGRTPLRSTFRTRVGELLIMPSEAGDFAGVKVASVNDGSAGPAVPRIQGLYLLFDAATLTPVAIMDGVALTAIRTASVSALAVDHLAVPQASRLVVFGAGPQAAGHVRAISAVRQVSQVRLVGRDPTRAENLAGRLRDEGYAVAVGSVDDVRDADVIACCTTSMRPLFDTACVADHATVVAVGSHHPDAREVDSSLVARATVVVETRGSAMAEAGDIVLAIKDGVPESHAIDGTLSALVAGNVAVDEGRPRFFKSVGEAWEDLVLAATAIHRA